MSKRYVTMTDKFMSGWGEAANRINKLIFVCDTWQEAEAVADNAAHRHEMKYINICYSMPNYSTAKYYPQIKTKEEYPHWYEAGYFANR